MRWLLASLAVLGLAGAQQAPRGGFVDVPPCHWAAEAVRALAAKELVQGSPAGSRELVENALRQVFEGLRCGDPGWSLEFLEGAPPGFATGAVGKIDGFELRGLQTRVSGGEATVSFQVVISEGGSVYTRRGTARLVSGPGGWRVVYSSLVALGLPYFR
ncbi:S-layer homology domain-containing protein [Calidithermus timidus]|jgi:hypothetical protein|uniref:S-layer homology domain-containing protein n=1 Tax=Calidithermus timidus TaxID=307124 RepID=UPI000378D9F0|nr:S-layer homology domain-containing protein [Calidithermus timidus]